MPLLEDRSPCLCSWVCAFQSNLLTSKLRQQLLKRSARLAAGTAALIRDRSGAAPKLVRSKECPKCSIIASERDIDFSDEVMFPIFLKLLAKLLQQCSNACHYI